MVWVFWLKSGQCAVGFFAAPVCEPFGVSKRFCSPRRMGKTSPTTLGPLDQRGSFSRATTGDRFSGIEASPLVVTGAQRLANSRQPGRRRDGSPYQEDVFGCVLGGEQSGTPGIVTPFQLQTDSGCSKGSQRAGHQLGHAPVSHVRRHPSVIFRMSSSSSHNSTLVSSMSLSDPTPPGSDSRFFAKQQQVSKRSSFFYFRT
ncbi:uncharacterized protein LOC130912132 [Corythoichthys intestinalis]|uniref:uncharacterized protein LOC130912132 n=1 Tax=Corythoichthys intestinalis TaxID=161448 RepID=UPI0025A63CAB|nr:uncharacterized protein LOC130912132 [Corythoichthys intestinalis]